MSPYPWAGPKVLEKVTPSRECLRAFPLELSSAHLGLRLAVLNIRPRFTQLCSQGRVRGLLPLPGVGLLLLLHQAVGERPAGAEDPAATQKPCRGLSPAKRWRGVTVGFFFPRSSSNQFTTLGPRRESRGPAPRLPSLRRRGVRSAPGGASWAERGAPPPPASAHAPQVPNRPQGTPHRPLRTAAATVNAPASSAAPEFKRAGSEGARLPAVELGGTEGPGWRPSGWRGTLGGSL